MGKEILRLKAFDEGILHAATQRTPVALSGTRLSVVVFNPMEYAVIVEFGRQPGGKPPPLIPLVAWAVRHRIATFVPVNVTFGGEYAKAWAASAAIMKHLGEGGGKSGKQKPMDPMVLDFLKVRMIAKKIAESGTAGRHPFTIAWERKAATFKADISATLAL